MTCYAEMGELTVIYEKVRSCCWQFSIFIPKLS